MLEEKLLPALVSLCGYFLHVSVHLSMFVDWCVPVSACVCVLVCVCVYVFACMCACVYVCVHIPVHLHTLHVMLTYQHTCPHLWSVTHWHAFTAADEHLLPQLHLWWIDGKTYVDFTRPWYAKIMPFPLNFFLPSRKQKAASLLVFLTKGGENINDSDVEIKVGACRHRLCIKWPKFPQCKRSLLSMFTK